MENFRFTLFNSITLLVLALTLLTAIRCFGAAPRSNWPPAYWAIALAYTFGFSRGLHPAWVGTGALCAILIRFGAWPSLVRWAELVALAYVAWRSVGLILLW